MTSSSLPAFYDRLSGWWLQHDFCDPAVVFCMEATFVESYCARAALRRLQFLGGGVGVASAVPSRLVAGTAAPVGWGQPTLHRDALVRSDVDTDDERIRLRQAVVAFCDRVVAHQGIQGAPAALFMGYGLQVANGSIQHSCVADQASEATAVLEIIQALPDHPRAPQWRKCVERWAGWVSEHFTRPNGGIGVGILSHEWNPIPEYWCATSLFAETLFHLQRVSHRDDYAVHGLLCLDWLATLELQKVEIPRFDEAPCEVILYAAEGVVEGLEYLARVQGVAAARAHPVWSKLTEMIGWLSDNQQADGNWPVFAGRGYHAYTLGIPWILLRASRLAGEPEWQRCAEKFFQFASSPAGEQFFGLHVRPWSMSLAWLSAGEFAGQERSA